MNKFYKNLKDLIIWEKRNKKKRLKSIMEIINHTD